MSDDQWTRPMSAFDWGCCQECGRPIGLIGRGFRRLRLGWFLYRCDLCPIMSAWGQTFALAALIGIYVWLEIAVK